jgi:uridine kinase
MKIAILISGLLRSFEINYNKLLSYFKDHDIDIYICTSKYNNTDSRYLTISEKNNKDEIHNLPFVKDILYLDDDIKSIEKEYNNLTKQWYKFYKLTKLIDNAIDNSTSKYDIIVKIRPDIHILEDCFNPDNIVLDTHTINIPFGYDIFNTELFGNRYDSVNDQIAIFHPSLLQLIANFYNSIWDNENANELPMVSEILFKHYLDSNNIVIKRFKLDYKLILSQCNIIAICGDSSSGKTTLCKLLEPLLPKTEKLILETDRYHKWERGDDNYKTYTHLNPYANHLEKMSEDVYRLKICDNIYTVDYDHSTGKFTPVENIEAKTNVILCGLHTLYIDKIKNLLNLKIFMDTDRELIKRWKIRRDVEERGHTLEKVIASIENREPDYYKYIDVQKASADIIIRYYLKTEDNNVGEGYDDVGKVGLSIRLKDFFLSNVKDVLEDKIICNNFYFNDNWIIMEFKDMCINEYNILIKNIFSYIISI